MIVTWLMFYFQAWAPFFESKYIWKTFFGHPIFAILQKKAQKYILSNVNKWLEIYNTAS